MTHHNSTYQKAFTIVELLVVIVVIGVLASISLVAYTGISKKAKEAAITSDLTNTSKRLKLHQVENSGYPADKTKLTDCPTPAAGSMCLKLSPSNTLGAYTVNNSVSPQTFCLTIKNGTSMVSHIDQDGVINDDACSYSFPVTLAAAASSRSQINLSWPVISGADSLTLERAKDSAFTIEKTTLTAPAASATTASSTGLTSSTTYYYRMKVTMGGDDSNWSNTASATTSAFTFPVTLAANSPVPTRNTISLSWPTVTGANSLTLQRATNNTFTTGLTTLTAPAAAATTASSTGLSALTTYYYRMSVTIGSETSNWSNTASNTTLDFPAPTGLAVTSKTASSINLSWNSVAGAVNYTLQRSSTADFASHVDATTASGTTVYASTGLTSGTYYYRINVIDAGGSSTWSGTLTATLFVQNYNIAGSYTWTVPAGVSSVNLEVWGAQGTDAGGGGGAGGYSKGNLVVSSGNTIYVKVGSRTEGGTGGGSINECSGYNWADAGGNGGGASDMRYGGNALANRKIVAGGGGGGSGATNMDCYGDGSPYGGLTGGFGGGDVSGGGGGSCSATQTAGYSLGDGGNAADFRLGGGGDGYWGGYGSCDGGGGGSGYIGGVTASQTVAGNISFPAPGGGNETGHTGVGYARIFY